jgi:hypothetical protein
MDHSFLYSTNGSHFAPYNDNAQYHEPNPQIVPDMNTPMFSDCVFAPTEYGMNYHTIAKPMKCVHTRYKEGYYIDVYGRSAKTNLNFPYVLQVYSPKPFEKRFQTKESALNEAPKMGDWRIVNIFSGQHVYAPFRQNTHSFQC